jgi:hypothetical protein
VPDVRLGAICPHDSYAIFQPVGHCSKRRAVHATLQVTGADNLSKI